MCAGRVKEIGTVKGGQQLEYKFRAYLHFRTNVLGEGMNPYLLPAMG